MLKLALSLAVAAMFAASFVPVSHAQSAFEQLQQAAEHGQHAVQAPTQEEAKWESNQVFDTPSSTHTYTNNSSSSTYSGGTSTSTYSGGSSNSDDDDE
jgi:hypothetical protein